MIYTARALAGRGHRVFVFNGVEKASVHDDVLYQPWTTFESFAEKTSFDVFISIRNLLPVLARRWAPLQIYFSPDAYDQPFVNRALSLEIRTGQDSYEVGLYSLSYAQRFVDAIFCVGQWQADTFIERFKLLKEKVFVMPNGVFLPDFKSPPLAARKRGLVYCSTPYRGLEYLLKMFPKIRECVPDATCEVLSGMQVYGLSDEEDRKGFQNIYDLARQEGVTLHGPKPKAAMAAILGESRVLAYPNTFAETFCIAALEAQASGLPAVTTSLAGLKERVEEGTDGHLIPGHPSQAAYQEAFIEKTAALLTQDSLWESMSQAARRKAEAYDYGGLALLWENRLLELSERRKESAALSPSAWLPSAQRFNALVGGYPKTIELSKDLLSRQMKTALDQAGFSRCARSFIS